MSQSAVLFNSHLTLCEVVADFLNTGVIGNSQFRPAPRITVLASAQATFLFLKELFAGAHCLPVVPYFWEGHCLNNSFWAGLCSEQKRPKCSHHFGVVVILDPPYPRPAQAQPDHATSAALFHRHFVTAMLRSFFLF